jgi:hypothetical protein
VDTVHTSSQGVVISTAGWIVTGVAAWLAVAVVVAVLVARMIRRRDRQVPTDAPRTTADDRPPGIPEQGGPLHIPGVVGRGRRDRD